MDVPRCGKEKHMLEFEFTKALDDNILEVLDVLVRLLCTSCQLRAYHLNNQQKAE
jgi:hypothetical protein